MPNLRPWFTLAISAAFLAPPAAAQALPIFAHRYGFSCQQCHTTVPQLNAFGRYFLANGFRLGGAAARGVVPVAVKVETAYTSGGDADADSSAKLPKAIVDEVEILSAGSLGRNASYYLENYAIDGGMPGRPRDNWIDLRQSLAGNDALGPQLHVRAGQFTLPLPADPETQRPTIASYALFSQTVGANAFDLFDPRVGADVYLNDDRHGFLGHFIVAQSADRGSGYPSSGVDLMGSVAQAIGSEWTVSAYRYQGGRALGPVRDQFYRNGYAASFAKNKFDAVAVVQNGNDSSADGFGLGALSSGGFLQTAWHFNAALSVYARYDDVYDPFNLRQTFDTLSVVTRPARNMRFTLEGRYDNTSRAYRFAGGLLFAY